MVRSSTTYQKKSSASSYFWNISLETAQDYILCVKVDSAPHGVDHRLGLLVDLLLHERGEVPLHDLLDLHLKSRDFPPCVILIDMGPGNNESKFDRVVINVMVMVMMLKVY